MKKLLHLYNYGHNPFPKLGRGGLGYHLPQYKLKGRGFDLDELKFVPDLIMTQHEADERNQKLLEDPLVQEKLEDLKQPIIRPLTKIDDYIEHLESLDPTYEYKPDEEEFEDYITNIQQKPPSYGNEELRGILERNNMKDREGEVGLVNIAKQLNINTTKKTRPQLIDLIIKSDKRQELKKILKESPTSFYHKKLQEQINRQTELNEYNIQEDLIDRIDNDITGQINYYLKKNRHINLSPDDIAKIRARIIDRKMSNKKDKNKYINGSDVSEAVDSLKLGNVDNDKMKVLELTKEINEIKSNDKLNKYPTKGEVFEDIMMTKYKDELYQLSNSKKSQFRSPEENPIYYDKKGDPITFQTRRVVNGVEQDVVVNMFQNTLYDAGNKDVELEFKYYPNDDSCEIQIGKFEGNAGEVPYFHEVNGQWKLFDVYNRKLGWVNKYQNKDLYVYAQLDDGRYKFSINKLIEDPDMEINEHPKFKGKYQLDMYKLIGTKFMRSTNPERNKEWIVLRKDQMDKIT